MEYFSSFLFIQKQKRRPIHKRRKVLKRATKQVDRELIPPTKEEAISTAFPIQPLLDLVEWHDPNDSALESFDELMGGLLPEFVRVRDEALGRASGVDFYVGSFQITPQLSA